MAFHNVLSSWHRVFLRNLVVFLFNCTEIRVAWQLHSWWEFIYVRMLLLAARSPRDCFQSLVAKVDRLHVIARNFNIVLIQSSLTDSRHERCLVAMRGSQLISKISIQRSIASIKLNQVLKNLSCSEISRAVRPVVVIDELLAFIDQGPSHL